jgi:hypothetical protein
MFRKAKFGWLLLLAALLAGNAWADPPGHHRRHHHYKPHSHVHADSRGGVSIGLTFGTIWPGPSYVHPRPWPHYPPYSHYPRWPHVHPVPVVPIVVTPPPVYIERQPSVPALEPGYWYYCNESQAYYPYVQQCAGSWVKVQPQSAR